MHGRLGRYIGQQDDEFIPPDAGRHIRATNGLSDPQGDGRGGESAWGGKFNDEITRDSALYQRGLGYKRGVVAMANSGPNTNGSQFFILHKDYPMPPNYTIFGRVTSGLEVVDILAELPTQRGGDGGMSKPVTPPVIRKIRLKK